MSRNAHFFIAVGIRQDIANLQNDKLTREIKTYTNKSSTKLDNAKKSSQAELTIVACNFMFIRQQIAELQIDFRLISIVRDLLEQLLR